MKINLSRPLLAMSTLVWLIGAFIFVAPAANADSWASAQPKAVISSDGQIVVRMTPGDSIGDTVGFAGAAKGKTATARWLRYRSDRYEQYQSASLVNPVAPMSMAVSNDGALFTLDNWHNVGYGAIVVIYSPAGKVLKKYELRDLYPSGNADSFARTVSSVWWRCVGADPQVDRDHNVVVDDVLGGRFTFLLSSGAFRYEPGKGQCKRP